MTFPPRRQWIGRIKSSTYPKATALMAFSIVGTIAQYEINDLSQELEFVPFTDLKGNVNSQLSENLLHHFGHLARYGRRGGQAWRLHPDKVDHLWHPGIALDHEVGHAVLVRGH
jgi:hypothetical protein